MSFYVNFIFDSMHSVNGSSWYTMRSLYRPTTPTEELEQHEFSSDSEFLMDLAYFSVPPGRDSDDLTISETLTSSSYFSL